MHRTTTRTARTALALLAAAVVVPVAASARPDDSGSGNVGAPSAQKPIATRTFAMGSHVASTYQTSSTRPDDRAGIRSVDGLAVRNADGAIWGVIDDQAVLSNEPSSMPLDPAIATALEQQGTSSSQTGSPFHEDSAVDPTFVPAQSTASVDPAYLRALNIRGEAMNAKYGLDPYTKALRVRGKALNEQYGVGASQTAVRPDDRGGIRSVDSVPATVSSGGFDWRDAGIGAIGAFGLSLLAAGGMLLTLHVLHQRRDKLAAL
jgi:hypothetical protein